MIISSFNEAANFGGAWWDGWHNESMMQAWRVDCFWQRNSCCFYPVLAVLYSKVQIRASVVFILELGGGLAVLCKIGATSLVLCMQMKDFSLTLWKFKFVRVRGGKNVG